MQVRKKTRRQLTKVIDDLISVNFPDELMLLLCIKSANLMMDEAEVILKRLPGIECDEQETAGQRDGCESGSIDGRDED